VALAAACARPLVVSVLCAPASRIDKEEYVRAAALLYEISKLDSVAVSCDTYRKDETGAYPSMNTFTAADTVFATMIAAAPQSWTREDAIIAAAQFGALACAWVTGWTAILAEAKEDEMEVITAFSTQVPYMVAEPADRFIPLALLLLDLVRCESDKQPEGVIAGALLCLMHINVGKPHVAVALWEAGVLDVIQENRSQYSPMDTVGRRFPVAGAMLLLTHQVAEQAHDAGIDVIDSLLDAGVVDTAISLLTAYQMLGNPQAANTMAVQYGVVNFLDMLLSSDCDTQVEPIIAKLRAAGVDCFRYLLDNPLVTLASMYMETGANATRVAALVWGRDDDLELHGLAFKQQDVDKIVELADHRGPAATFFPMRANHGHPILSLCVSE
jgi:hypothetical protein